MQRTQLNLVIDTAIFACFVVLVSTGAIMHWLLPSGSGHAQFIWGMTRHDWGAAHFWIAVAMVALVATHLALHWKWILAMVRGKPGPPASRSKRTILAGAIIGGIAIAAMAPWASGVIGQEATYRRANNHISLGQITMAELQQHTGVAPEVLCAELGLPPQVAASPERLGRLGRVYGFTLADVRDAMERADAIR